MQSCLTFLLALIALVALTPGCAVSAAEDPVKSELQEEKLRQEITKIRLENEKLDSRWSTAISLAPFLTSLVALFGVLITLSKHLSEQTRQRALDRDHLEAERIQRFNEKFTSVTENLGSQSVSIQASAAVSIMTFLRPENAQFHEQVFLLLLANLKVGHDEVVQELLTNGFEKAVRLQADKIAKANDKIEAKEDKIVLDLSGCTLISVDLAKVDLAWADLKRSSLRNANLRKANLKRVKGNDADFAGAKASGAKFEKARFDGACFKDANLRATDLKWIHFKHADLSNCQFQQAQLQGAHLEHASLAGARFEQADLNNAFFIGSHLDETAKTSIIKAFNWRLAKFDPEVQKELEAIEQHILAGKTPDSN